MKFFIVTPTYNSCRWLPACIASVRNQTKHEQEMIIVHHHVQDGGSSDGTVEYLEKYQYSIEKACPNGYSFSFSSEADKGMYDAINKGWGRAEESVDWLGHLNSDEQYQPDALAIISEACRKHPTWGAITGNCILINEEGLYLDSRKPSVGWSWVGRIWIPAFTCSLFLRRSYYGSGKVLFDESWKSLGDKVFCRELLSAGCRFGYIDRYIALFTIRKSDNLGFQPITEEEKRRYRQDVMTARDRRWEWMAVLVAKSSRVARCLLGMRCDSFIWINPQGHAIRREAKGDHWTE